MALHELNNIIYFINVIDYIIIFLMLKIINSKIYKIYSIKIVTFFMFMLK